MHPLAVPAPVDPAAPDRVVLVVDDAAADRDLHCLLLRGWGLRPVSAADGVEALVCARTLLPRLVVTDLRMPRLDGWGLLERLRAARETAAIPVLLVSGDAPDVPAARVAASGAAALLGKPLDFGQFRDATLRALAAPPGPR